MIHYSYWETLTPLYQNKTDAAGKKKSNKDKHNTTLNQLEITDIHTDYFIQQNTYLLTPTWNMHQDRLYCGL